MTVSVYYFHANKRWVAGPSDDILKRDRELVNQSHFKLPAKS